VRYAARLRRTRRTHGGFLVTHHRRAAYYARHIATRRCQQNPIRWLALWNRKTKKASE